MSEDQAHPGRRRTWGLLAAGWVAGLACVGLAVLAVIEGGLFDATASKPHAAPVAWAAHTTFKRSVRLRAGQVTPPAPVDAAGLYAGFRAYDADCSSCHGGPGVPRGEWVRGMNPTPPYLLDMAGRWDRRELYWIVAKGVKMTGMPAWGASRSDAEIWDLVGFLQMLPCLSPAQYDALRRSGGRPPAPMPTRCPAPAAAAAAR